MVGTSQDLGAGAGTTGWVAIRRSQNLMIGAKQSQDNGDSLLTQVTTEMGVVSGELPLSSLLQLFIFLLGYVLLYIFYYVTS